VDAAAEAELEAFFFDQSLQHPTERHSVTKSLNLFLEHYAEDYDFVLLVNTRTLENVPVAGIFEAVTNHAEPGGSQPIEISASGYKTTGRIKGVIGIPYRAMYYPPFSHELSHHWAQYLHESFGFGKMLDEDFGPHWGASSVNGQLGGFDGSTLRCSMPVGAMPPACTALPSGRTRYVVGAFGPFANGFRGTPYGPLELYLMGLLPAAEAPETFQVLSEAKIDDTTYDQAAGTFEIEASGITNLPFADIRARHGDRVLLPEAERHFKAAFVVISSQPAPDDVMADVARWAAIFGNRLDYANWSSFELDTGGLATLDTQLGPRRTTENPAPPPREPVTCDVISQDCPRPELACYRGSAGYCAIHEGVEKGEPCDSLYSCAPGLDCISSNAAPTVYTCQPYCDIAAPAGANGCQTLCDGDYVTLGSMGQMVAGLCLP
jgi:hypothetical protein